MSSPLISSTIKHSPVTSHQSPQPKLNTILLHYLSSIMDCFSSHCSPYQHRHTHSKSRTTKPASSRGTLEPLRIPLDLVPSPIAKPSSPSPLSLLRSPSSPNAELLLLSPASSRRSKARFDEELPELSGVRRRCKKQTASPRSSRRWRREDKEAVLAVDEIGKQRRRRHSGRHNKKDKLSLVPFLPPPSSSFSLSPKAEVENEGDLDHVGALITDLIMWKDVSKSTLWFGFGCLCFLSSCFTKGFNFSIFSAISRLAIILLGVSFCSNSVCQRNQVDKRGYVNLKEDDILRLAKLILPALNFAISKTRELFSGEPSMTLKVVPFLLLGAEYGHLITIWRLCATGFFFSFSIPKIYSCHSAQINQQVECLKLRLLNTWSACTHKKIVVASMLITFWNLSTIKTRIFTAFILLVILRYFRHNVVEEVEDEEAQVAKKEQQQALVVAKPEEEEPQQALVIAERQHQSCTYK